MKVLSVLWILLAAGVVMADEPTNLVEVLRNYQKELDAQQRAGGPAEVQRPARKKSAQPAAATTQTPVPNVARPDAVVPAPAASVPAVSVPAASAPVGGADPDTFVKGDSMSLEVVDEPDLSLPRAVVAEDGSIQCPMVGKVVVVGKTAAEVAEQIRAALAKDYLVDPKVNVRMEEREQCHFSILLHVAKPGTYTWPCREGMTLLRAIGMAGGVTRSAQLSNITVRRKVDGKAQVLRVDLDAMNRDRTAASFPLRSGDVVEVGGR